MHKHKKIYYTLLQFAGFNVLLEFGRILYSGNVGFIFLIWNLFLAIIPLVISYHLLSVGTGKKLEVIGCFLLWLLILPNAPYLVTDLIHFGVRSDMPQWFDLALLFSYALCGLLIGVISILFMLQYLHRHTTISKQVWLLPLICLLTGFGVYIGRFLRWNSWSILTHPIDLLRECTMQVMHPMQYSEAWAITALFAVLMAWSVHFTKSLTGINVSTK
jgi:uncharacterized membrane protein